MKFKFIGKRPVNFGNLGDVHPGDVFDIKNKDMLYLMDHPLFKKVTEHKKKEVKKEEPKKEAV